MRVEDALIKKSRQPFYIQQLRESAKIVVQIFEDHGGLNPDDLQNNHFIVISKFIRDNEIAGGGGAYEAYRHCQQHQPRLRDHT